MRFLLLFVPLVTILNACKAMAPLTTAIPVSTPQVSLSSPSTESKGEIIWEVTVSNSGKEAFCVQDYDETDFVSVYKFDNQNQLYPNLDDLEGASDYKTPEFGFLAVGSGKSVKMKSILNKANYGYFVHPNNEISEELNGPFKAYATVSIPAFPCEFKNRTLAQKKGKLVFISSPKSDAFFF